MARKATKLAAMGLTGALVTGGVLIETDEGHVPGTYLHPVGIITACYGHTSPELEHVAYQSFHYNVGGGNFRSSTLLRYINGGHRVEACNQLTR